MVDDEVKRSTRLHKIPGFVHTELDEKSRPRKLTKEDTALMEDQLKHALEKLCQKIKCCQLSLCPFAR
jgi:hypothetical protein